MPINFSFSLDSALNSDAKKFFDNHGYLIINNVIPETRCKIISNMLDSVYSFQKSTNKVFKHIDDPLNIRIWNLLSKTNLCDDLLTCNLIDSTMNHIFSRNTSHQLFYLSSFQGCILLPFGKRQKMHIDTPVPEPVPKFTLKANTIWAIDDFTLNNGATEFIPRSHKREFKPNMSNYNNDEIEVACMPKGSVLITNGSLWHRGGENKSNAPRRCLFGSFAASWLREASIEEDTCRLLSINRINSSRPELLKIIGYHHGVRDS